MHLLRRYPITFGIIFLNTVFFLYSALVSKSFADIDLRVLVDLGALYGPLVVLQGEWWRLLTAMFLHGGMTHILMNMVSLYVIGRGMELYFSRTAYIAIYLFSGLIGGMVSLAIHPESVGIGASGAIFGVFGALGGFFLAHRRQIASHSREIMQDFAVVLGLNLVMGLSIASIDMGAHIGGLSAGAIGGFMIAKYPRRGMAVFFGLGLMALMIGIWYLRQHYVQRAIGSLLLSSWLLAGCTYQPERNDRTATTQHLFRLLKGLDPDIPAEESQALSREIMTRSAALEHTFHRTTLPWIHNLMVNIGLRQKGLCYQYADGLYYDLRSKHYPHFSFHLAGAHIGEYWREHNTLVVTAKDGRVEDGVIVDPWRETGKVFVARLKDDTAYTWKHRPEREIKNVAACRVSQSGT